MRRIAVLTLAFASTALAADETPDWIKYTSHGKIQGVIVKGELDKITLQIPALEKGKGNNDNNNGKGRNRPNVRIGTEDVEIPYAPWGIARWEKLQPGGDGKLPTGKALEALKLPLGAPGYAAEKTELRAGLIVEVHLVRPREVTAAKATPKDLSIKYVIITGETKAPLAKTSERRKIDFVQSRYGGISLDHGTEVCRRGSPGGHGSAQACLFAGGAGARHQGSAHAQSDRRRRLLQLRLARSR